MADSLSRTASQSTIPSPRQATPPLPIPTRHVRRPSLPISPSLAASSPRSPVPVPQRHGPSPTSPAHARHRKAGSFSLSASLCEDHASLPSSARLGAGDGQLYRSSSARLSQSYKAEEDDSWLDIAASDILRRQSASDCVTVHGCMGTEEAVDLLIKSDEQFLLVEQPTGQWGFFDYSDLNTFLLVVLQASTSVKEKDFAGPTGQPAHLTSNIYSSARTRSIANALRNGEHVAIGDLCNVSQKSPYHSFPTSTPVRVLLPVFSSGIHRIAVSSPSRTPSVLTDVMLLEYLLELPAHRIPSVFHLPVSSRILDLSLPPFISLPGSASVLDAMQVMDLHGLGAIGVLARHRGGAVSLRRRSGSSSSDSSAGSASTSSPLFVGRASETLSPDNCASATSSPGELASVVTTRECNSLVIPSEGKQVLGMGLEELVKQIQILDPAGRARGEDRVPVNTVTSSTTLLRASHLLLATSVSRVFCRSSEVDVSPPTSPVPSLSMSVASPPSSPSVSSLSLTELRTALPLASISGLPPPPQTQLSTYQVISVLDILSSLAKVHHSGLLPPPPPLVDSALETASPSDDPSFWSLDPAGMGKRRRLSTLMIQQDENVPVGFESWRWVDQA